MSAGSPKEKASEYISIFANMLRGNHAINEMDYRRYVRELEKCHTESSISALGMLHAVAGKTDKAIDLFETALSYECNMMISFNYCFVLQCAKQRKKLYLKTLEFANIFESKELTAKAYTYAYQHGDIDAVIHYIDRHIKLLSDEEKREEARKQKGHLLADLNNAYQTSKCSKEQLRLLADIVWDIIDRLNAETGVLEIKGNSYLLDILNKTPREIAEMNFTLAEAVCMEPQLDDCELIARFSAKKVLYEGICYGYKKL